jgi:tetratricopeptide (TPR) repeat protein
MTDLTGKPRASGASWPWAITAAVVMVLVYPLALWMRGAGAPSEAQQLAAASLLDESLQHAQAGRFRECMDAAAKSVELSPSAQAFNNLGWCAGNLQRWDEAIRNAEEAIRLSPDQPLFQNNLAWIRERKLEAEGPIAK